jgi:hypothetical protein
MSIGNQIAGCHQLERQLIGSRSEPNTTAIVPSMSTVSITASGFANRRLTALIRELDERRRAVGDDSVGASQRTVSEAVDRFLQNHGELDENRKYRGTIEYATWRKYRTKLNLLCEFCDAAGISELADVTVDVLEDFRRTRKIGLVTWKVELQALRTFFGYVVSRKWITINPAKEIRAPRNIKPNEVVPYTLREESLILGVKMVRRGGLVLSRVIENKQVIHVTKRQKFQQGQKHQIKSHGESHGLRETTHSGANGV